MEIKNEKKTCKFKKNKGLSAKSSVDSKNLERKTKKLSLHKSVNSSAIYEQNKSPNLLDKDIKENKSSVNKERNNSQVNKLKIPVQRTNILTKGYSHRNRKNTSLTGLQDSPNPLDKKEKGRNHKNMSFIEINTTAEKTNKPGSVQRVKNNSFDLYERTKNIMLQKKIQAEENEKIKEQKEVQGCTFQPVVNKNKHSKNSLRIYKIDHEKREIDFFDRISVWNGKKNDKIELLRHFKKKEENECTFHPKINKNSFNLSCEVNDKSAQRYLERIKNARKLKEETEEKLSKNINNIKSVKIVHNENNPINLNKMRFSLIKSCLKSELHSIKFNQD